MKKNCWEFKNCGREPGGSRAKELGVCSAAKKNGRDGTNGGTNGGRYCWKIAGTLCGVKPQGTFAEKLDTCVKCDFFKLVKGEEGKEIAY